MVITDAACLSHGMAAHTGEPEAALEAFRARRVQFQSRAIGEHVYHPAGAHALLRDAVMSAKSSEDWYEELAWLYGGGGSPQGAELKPRPSSS